MNMRQKSGKEKGCDVGERVVLVAVKASKEIPRSKKLWGLPRFNSDCAAGNWRSLSGTISDQKEEISDSCTQLMLQLHDIKMKIKVVSGSSSGVVATEAKKSQTQWVVLDKQLKKEAKLCMEQLECNVVVMKKSRPKVLRLNLVGSPTTEPEELSGSEKSAEHVKKNFDLQNETRVPNVTPASSPEHSPFSTTDVGTSSISSLDPTNSPFFISEINWDRKKDSLVYTDRIYNLDESDSDTDSEKMSSPSTSLSSDVPSSSELAKYLMGSSRGSNGLNSRPESLWGKFSELEREHEVRDRLNLNSSKNVREMISLPRSSPLEPPPLCSICQHKAPVFGKPPRWFTYGELEHATRRFSEANFLAEGGYGSVHRGVLPDGQVVAVKQHKLASSQGDHEFCSEVEVLSCAQHRNVVMLIGLCVEDGRRLLVYEYICNGSLDSHLYGHDRDPLEWSARQKIAVGAARGLRYLHEECRVGCIVHRDMRPNNILLTHDFEPLVGDFGLARWQPDGDLGVETRIIGTFGYLAPEYAQSGEITEKADVYSFGIVLVELITGRKAIDISRPKGQQCLSEWARPLLKENFVEELVDPRLRKCYSEKELNSMLRCASMCIRRDPHLRPRMSQVIISWTKHKKIFKGIHATRRMHSGTTIVHRNVTKQKGICRKLLRKILTPSVGAVCGNDKLSKALVL
ncbi:hypothetical protein LguiB_011837 [Lonicera macranthoides]